MPFQSRIFRIKIWIAFKVDVFGSSLSFDEILCHQTIDNMASVFNLPFLVIIKFNSFSEIWINL